MHAFIICVRRGPDRPGDSPRVRRAGDLHQAPHPDPGHGPRRGHMPRVRQYMYMD